MAELKRIVFAGAGHAVLVALHQLARHPAKGAELTLISRGDHSHYSGLMPGWIEGLYADHAAAIALEPVVRRAGAARIDGSIVGIEGERVLLADGREVPYDALVLNTGSASRREGALYDQRVIGARPIGALPDRLGPYLEAAGSFVVVGAGVAGIETAFALKARRPDAAVNLVERAEALLPAHSARFRRAITRTLRSAGIGISLASTVVEVADAHVRLSTGLVLPAQCVLSLCGAAPPAWLDRTPFARAPDGFIATDAAMRSVSHPNVIVAGDVGTTILDPRPKAGVFAVRAGPHVAAAVRAWGRDERPRSVHLQRRGLVLLAIGGRRAVGTRNGITLSGRWVWRLKDRLDRGFVAKFSD